MSNSTVRFRFLLPLLVLTVFGLAGCKEEREVLTVGAKDFTENQLMGEMMARMAEQAGITVQRAIPYGASAVTFEALKQGKLDVYPEYNGTGLVYIGQAPLTDGDAALERVRKLYGELGLDWRARLGFSNDYVLVMRPERAQALGIKKISDLTGQPAVDIATDATFVERPLDGLGAMMRRYGLTQGKLLAYKLADGGKDKITKALLDDEVLVAELFRTDQQIAGFDLTVLKDDLSFFPVYEPSPLVRADALERFAELGPALAKLENTVSADDMRGMIKAVELEGRSVGAVVLDFLAAKGLVDATAATEGAAGAEPLMIGMGGLDTLSGPSGKAVRAARSVYSKRPIEVLRSANPLELVTSGEARLAVVGVESFYALANDRAVRESEAEALGVVGYRMAHVVVADDGPASLADVKKLGVGEAGSASDRVARMVLSGLGKDGVTLVPGVSGDLEARFQVMSKELVDAIFVMAPVGDKTVLNLMQSGTYRLLPIEGWNDGNAPLRFSFLRNAKIAAGSYANQTAAVETLSTQMVLAGPRGEREEIGAQGPGTTGTSATQPIPAETVRGLSKALGSAELVDPAAPAATALRPELEEGPQPLVADLTASVINLLASFFLIWMVYLLVARAPHHPSAKHDEYASDLHITPASGQGE